MTTEWRKQVEDDMNFARDTLMTNGHITPMFVLHCADGKRLVGTRWGDGDEKRLIRTVITLMGIAHNANAISFISEAWVGAVMKRDDESQDSYNARVDAAMAEGTDTLPDREEVIMVTTTYRDDEGAHTIMVTGRIERDTNGAVTGVVNAIEAGSGEELQGPMTELLCPYEPDAGMRQRALERLATVPGLKETPIVIN